MAKKQKEVKEIKEIKVDVAPEVVSKVAKVGVELDNDIPNGPKKGVRYFDNKADAEAYQKRFGGKFVA